MSIYETDSKYKYRAVTSIGTASFNEQSLRFVHYWAKSTEILVRINVKYVPLGHTKDISISKSISRFQYRRKMCIYLCFSQAYISHRPNGYD